MAKPSSFVSTVPSEDGLTWGGIRYIVRKNERTGKTYAEAVAGSFGHATKRDARLAVLQAALDASGIERPLQYLPFSDLKGLL